MLSGEARPCLGKRDGEEGRKEGRGGLWGKFGKLRQLGIIERPRQQLREKMAAE